VLFILSILVVIVTQLARHAQYAADAARARADIAEILDALDRYHLRFGYYPAPDPGAGALPDGSIAATNLLAWTQTLPGGAGLYFFANELPEGFTATDPWKRPYQYRLSVPAGDPEAEESCTVYSRGPETGTDDDDIRIQR
jgi:type II secretory pathway pseudopilin PulG